MVVARASRENRQFARLDRRLVISEGALSGAERALRTFKSADAGRHEGLVYWAGVRLPGIDLVLSTIVPASESGPGFVEVSAAANARAIAEMGSLGQCLVAQVHSHPPLCGARHSPGDNHLVLMPFEGLLSLVVADYAEDGLRPIHSVGFHVYSGGHWWPVDPGSVAVQVSVAPTILDLR